MKSNRIKFTLLVIVAYHSKMLSIDLKAGLYVIADNS